MLKTHKRSHKFNAKKVRSYDDFDIDIGEWIPKLERGVVAGKEILTCNYLYNKKQEFIDIGHKRSNGAFSQVLVMPYYMY